MGGGWMTVEGVVQLRVLLEASMARELIWDGREKNLT